MIQHKYSGVQMKVIRGNKEFKQASFKNSFQT